MRTVLVLVVVLVLGAGAAFFMAGRSAGPAIQIDKPEKFIGAATPLDVRVSAPGAKFTALSVDFEQGGSKVNLFSLDDKAAASSMTADGADAVKVSRKLGRNVLPSSTSGPARIVVTAERPVLFGLRRVKSQSSRDVNVRWELPRVGVLSTKHYIHRGGSEMIIYKATPADVRSGVIVGDREFVGFPIGSDPTVHAAFFSLSYDQDVNTPMHLFAADEAGNSARADFDNKTFQKVFKKSRIPLDDKFLDRVVPAILQGSPSITPGPTTLDTFLKINGDLRRQNAEKIASLAAQTAPQMLWNGVVFHPFGNNAVEAAFADYRTYLYKDKEVDHQVHLGFDLASFTSAKIVAANRGKVLYAEDLGIYGNCVIIDHGMGVQSLYAHLSVIDVKPGEMVEKEQQIGKSGMTGLAAGDHLHFTMLVNGHPVNPIEWWDAHWIQDRILRKLDEAGIRH